MGNYKPNKYQTQIEELRGKWQLTFDCLRLNVDNGIMTSEEAQEKFEVEKAKIINEHEKHHKITLASDGRWKTRLPDGSNGGRGRLIAKKNKRDLEEEIIQFYTLPSKITFEQLYDEWIEYKIVDSKTSTYIARIKSSWSKYYKHDKDFITKDISKLTVADLTLWLNNLLKHNPMKRREFYNITVIIKQSLEYAVNKGYIDNSPYDKVRVNKKLLIPTKKAKCETQVYTFEEQERMEQYMWEKFQKKPEYTASLAVILMFHTGLRNGELVALRKSDIEGNYIHIQRQETRKYVDLNYSQSKMSGYQVVDYTKSEAGDRKVPLDDTAKKLIHLALETNEKNGWQDEDYIFVHKNVRINHYAIESRVREACDHLGMIHRKSPHKFRKTYISTLIDAGVPLDDVRKTAGHEDVQTTLKNYYFSRDTEDESYDKVVDALEKSKPSVTQCNTVIIDFPQKEKCGEPA